MSPRGLLGPLRRDRQRDFASADGMRLLADKVTHLLATEGETPRSSGELPWRTSFGSALHLLRHRNDDDALADLSRVYVRDALKRWVPEAELVDFDVTQAGDVLTLRMSFQPARPGGAAEGATTLEVSLPRAG